MKITATLSLQWIIEEPPTRMNDQKPQKQLDDFLLEAARLLATAVNTCDPEPVINRLGAEVKYETQSSFEVLSGRSEVADFLRTKMAAIKGGELPTHGEVGRIGSGEPGVIIRQEGIRRTFWLPSIDDEGKISSISGCTVAPHPDTARGLGETPGLNEKVFQDAENERIENRRSWVKSLNGPIEFIAFVLSHEDAKKWRLKLEAVAEDFLDAKYRVSVHDHRSKSRNFSAESQKYEIVGYPAIAVIKDGEVIRAAAGTNNLADVILDLEQMGEFAVQGNLGF
jgi:hypothetical protein